VEAKRNFTWPTINEFNRAIDFFDKIAENRTNPAIIYVDDEVKRRRLVTKS